MHLFYPSIFHLQMHRNEDVGKTFQDANGELSSSHYSASRVQGWQEKRSNAYWYKEQPNLSCPSKQFT